MDKNTFISTLLGTMIGTSISISTIYGASKLYKNINKKSEQDDCIKEEIAKTKREIDVYSDMVEKLKKESYKIVGYITENTMNYNDLQKFDTKTWSDKLTVVNETWRNAEVQKKFYETKLDVLMDKLSSHTKN